ncbi:MAG: pantetheine-phosphate adenylyltransferase [Actinomycetota bacterium]|jgi:pantetheine-phosphate adenylyltransferase
MPKIAVYPGSFDPFTVGHLDIAERTSELFDELVIAVVHNPNKTPMFSLVDRVELVEQTLAEAGLSGIRVVALESGLLVDLCTDVGADVIVKGARSATDVDFEFPMAQINRELTGIETAILISAPELSHVSSSLVRQLAQNGGDVRKYVAKPVQKLIEKKFKNK